MVVANRALNAFSDLTERTTGLRVASRPAALWRRTAMLSSRRGAIAGIVHAVGGSRRSRDVCRVHAIELAGIASHPTYAHDASVSNPAARSGSDRSVPPSDLTPTAFT